jgi:uncharacterized protein (TIGR02722 family)
MMKSLKKAKMISAALVLMSLVIGCTATTRIHRVDERTLIDLSGKWNDTDSQIVSEEIIQKCLSHHWQGEFVDMYGKIPVVIVGTVYNRTDEHIDSNIFIKNLEQALINSGRARIVQSQAARDELRAERQEQQEFASAATRKRLREELGADFILQGTIGKITDMEGRQRVYFYQVSVELINIETAEKVWLDQSTLKKYVKKAGASL